MNLYDFIMNPLELLLLRDIRKRCIPFAYGNVLEIGIGIGANLPYYNRSKVRRLTGLDIKISKEVMKKAKSRFKLVESDVEKLPFPDNSFDTVVTTLLLCSVTDLDKSISEIKRVLKTTAHMSL